MFARFIVGSGFVLAWLSAFLIPKSQFKRFMPSALLASLLLTIAYELAYALGWWKIKKTIVSVLKITDYSFVLGPFFVGTIWVCHLTYKLGFTFFLLTNLCLDSFFCYYLLPFLEKIGVAKLKKISYFGVLCIMQTIALMIYPIQKWQDEVFQTKQQNYT